MPRRHVVPPAGGLLVSTDVHGHGDDMRRLEQRFRTALAQEPETHWVILGDPVHAPDERAGTSLSQAPTTPTSRWPSASRCGGCSEFPRQVH